jgi:predicted metalloprotease with PDZ domain
LYFSVPEWKSYRRGTDFYSESILIWLEVDTTIRRLTDDRKSIDDFCQAFYSGHEGEPAIKTYTFEDLVSTLNGIAAYDWAAFFRARLDSTASRAPLGGIDGGGWRLVYNDVPNEFLESQDSVSGGGDFTSSLGLEVKQDGSVVDAIPGMPAFESGISPYTKIISANGRKYSVDNLKRAIEAAKTGKDDILIQTDNAGRITSHVISYHDGSRFPHLERIDNSPDYIGEILQAKTAAGNK